jgi:hypothetical protein
MMENNAENNAENKNIFPYKIFKVVKSFRIVICKLLILLSYFGIIFVPIIIYASLINKLEWGKYDHKPTPESIVKFKEISLPFIIIQTIVAFFGGLQLRWGFNTEWPADFWCKNPFLLQSIFSYGHTIYTLIVWEMTNLMTLIIWTPDSIVTSIAFIPVFTYVIGCLITIFIYRECEQDNKEEEDEDEDLSSIY